VLPRYDMTKFGISDQPRHAHIWHLIGRVSLKSPRHAPWWP
jgi:Ni,Fe-hydrogenase III small subunit